MIPLFHNVALEFFSEYEVLFIVFLFIGTFGLTFYLIPKVLWVSKKKNLMAEVNERSSHRTATPNFGGVAFYITLILVLSFLQNMRLTYIGNQFIAAATILFMVGLQDDLVISTPRVKFFGQVLAVSFLIFSTDLPLDHLYGFLGLEEIPFWIGYIIKGFLAVGLINAYNLIDGIDGLASIIAIIISIVFAVVFYFSNETYFMLVSISLVGILCAYLRYNFSNGTKKIFMGDSGSLVVGLLLAFLSVKYLTMEPSPYFMERGYEPATRLLFLACVLFIPIFDTLRVIIIRKMNRESPFKPDRSHAHHVLLDLGFSHKKASIWLGTLNILIVFLFFIAANKVSVFTMLLLIVGFYGATFFLFHKLKKKVSLEVESIG